MLLTILTQERFSFDHFGYLLLSPRAENAIAPDSLCDHDFHGTDNLQHQGAREMSAGGPLTPR
jgi:hypothetical protein